MIHPKFQDLDIEVSQPMKLEAEVTGHPAPLVEWQLNGVKVDRSNCPRIKTSMHCPFRKQQKKTLENIK